MFGRLQAPCRPNTCYPMLDMTVHLLMQSCDRQGVKGSLSHLDSGGLRLQLHLRPLDTPGSLNGAQLLQLQHCRVDIRAAFGADADESPDHRRAGGSQHSPALLPVPRHQSLQRGSSRC